MDRALRSKKEQRKLKAITTSNSNTAAKTIVSGLIVNLVILYFKMLQNLGHMPIYSPCK